MPDNTVVRKTAPITHVRAVELTADGVRQAAKRVGKDKLAKAGDCGIRVVEKWIAEGSLPGVDKLLNMATVAPEVMTPLLSEMGWNALTKAQADPANDFDLVSNLSSTLTEFLQRIADGHRCHVDTAVLAGLFRMLMPQMQAIVDEDDRRQREHAA